MIRDRVAGQRFLKPAFEDLPDGPRRSGPPMGRTREFSMGIFKGLWKAFKVSKPWSIELGFFNSNSVFTATSPARSTYHCGRPIRPDNRSYRAVDSSRALS
jgi:hypothetical protein